MSKIVVILSGVRINAYEVEESDLNRFLHFIRTDKSVLIPVEMKISLKYFKEGRKKMSSQAQINANRNNSQKSTGPRSDEGKAAVSKNALKHGLFTNEAVIAGESIDDYNLNREQLLDELKPIGKMETILAERVVSLTWRLKRIEKFQNIVIDAMIDEKINNPLTKLTKRMLPAHLRREQDEDENLDLTLGNVIIDDYGSSRVLDRLSIYERRIENSMFKTMAELKKWQLMRELEEQRDDGGMREENGWKGNNGEKGEKGNNGNNGQKVGKACVSEERDTNLEKRVDLKKQSQYAGHKPEILSSKSEILTKQKRRREKIYVGLMD